jgi:hypothetical protein
MAGLSEQLLLSALEEERFGIHVGTRDVMEGLIELFGQLVCPIVP